MKIIARTRQETAKAAETFVAALAPETSATTVGLSGDLGSGKTTFVKAAAKALGVGQVVTSPTFVIEKIYKLHGQSFEHLIHIDAYRLERGHQLHPLGFATLVQDPENLIFIEWPERVADVLPHTMRTVLFSFIDEDTRSITY